MEFGQVKSVERGCYSYLIGDSVVKSRHTKSMSEIERRYLNGVLEEAIAKHGVNFSNHCLERMKQRNLSKGRVRMAVEQGTIQEVQFTKDGCVFLISFATGSQLTKGYVSVAGYDVLTGNICTVFNKQLHSECKIDPLTHESEDKKYMLNENCLELVHDYLDVKPTNEEIVRLVRVYNRGNMDDKSEKKLNNFRLGKTFLSQL